MRAPPQPHDKAFQTNRLHLCPPIRRATWSMSCHQFARSLRQFSRSAGTPAHSIFSLSMLVFSVTATIFLIVGALLLYALLRFRRPWVPKPFSRASTDYRS